MVSKAPGICIWNHALSCHSLTSHLLFLLHIIFYRQQLFGRSLSDCLQQGMARQSRHLLKHPLPETPSTLPGWEEMQGLVMTQVLLWETAVILEEDEITFKPSLVLERGTPHAVAWVHSWAWTKLGFRCPPAEILEKIQLLYWGSLNYIKCIVSDTVNTSEGIQIPRGILYLHTDPSYITPLGKVPTENTETDLRHISRAEDISKNWSSWDTKTWHWEKMHKRCLPCSCSGSG